MSGIRVQTFAEKIVNKGGGMKSGHQWLEARTDRPEPDEIYRNNFKVPQPDGSGKVVLYKKYRVEKKQTGSDYIVFNCPVCKTRSKRCAYDAKTEEEGKLLVFRCHKCYNEIEVKRPLDLSLEMVHAPGGILDKNGKAIS